MIKVLNHTKCVLIFPYIHTLLLDNTASIEVLKGSKSTKVKSTLTPTFHTKYNQMRVLLIEIQHQDIILH